MKCIFSLPTAVLALAIFTQTLDAQEVFADLAAAPNLMPELQTRLSDKIRAAFYRSQIQATEPFSEIVIRPNLSFTGGVPLNPKSASNRKMIAATFSCAVVSRDGKQQFGFFTLREGVTAESDTAAQFAFVENLKLEGRWIDSVINSSVLKIRTFYDKNCPKMLEKAAERAGFADYRSAFPTFVSIPKSSVCRAKADSLMLVCYAAQREAFFSHFLEKAKKEAEAQNWQDALLPLAYLDPESPSMAEADKTMNTIGRRLVNENDRIPYEELREKLSKKQLGLVDKTAIWRSYLLDNR